MGVFAMYRALGCACNPVNVSRSTSKPQTNHLHHPSLTVAPTLSKHPRIKLRFIYANALDKNGIDARPPKDPAPSLYNTDLSPVLAADRSYSSWDMAALWVGLVVSVSSWFLAGGLVELGMDWKQGVATVFLGNAITLAAMTATGVPGTRYGIPFPVLARTSFGVRGALLPAALRGMVACGWFGIQTWLGGASLHQMLKTLVGESAFNGELIAPPVAWLGINIAQLACFWVFWGVQLAIILQGMEGVRKLERYAAPVLILMCAALLAWAVSSAGGMGPMLSAPSHFSPGMPKEGQFWSTFLPALTANVGYWASLALNIPDFTRYAKSQRAQILGQTVGLPLFMAAFAFVGLTVTSATCVIFNGPAISDPIILLGKLQGVGPTIAALAGLLLATLTTNVAANVVAPANALISFNPGFSFESAAVITALAGAAIMPWRLIASAGDFLFKWLIGYSVVLGPVAGVVLVDYYALRKGIVDIDALYSEDPEAAYAYKGGVNHAALWAVAAGAAPCIPGFLHEIVGAAVPAICKQLYAAAWFVGVGVGALVYYTLMHAQRRQQQLKGKLENLSF